MPQIADAVTIPVIAAGGIADGRGIAAALTLGAHGVQIGTGFLATDESGASEIHKQALHGPDARVTVLTRVFSGRLARAIPNHFIRQMAPHETAVPPYPIQNALMLPIRRAAGERGLADYVNLWAGQAAPLTHAGPAATYLRTLVEQTNQALNRHAKSNMDESKHPPRCGPRLSCGVGCSDSASSGLHSGYRVTPAPDDLERPR